MTQETKLPLCEAILGELWDKAEGTDAGVCGYRNIPDAEAVVNKHPSA